MKIPDHSPDSVLEYIKRLATWNPDSLIRKIKANEPLDEFDLTLHKVGQNLPYILEKIKDVHTDTKERFMEFVEEHLATEIPERPEGFKILK